MKILHFADLHLGVESYGHVDPLTGLSSRLIDFLSVFDQVVDYALENKIDLILFCGDAYKTREPSQTQQREFAKRINRLSVGGIPVFLLTGNHDLPNAVNKATTTEIFDTLAIKNVYVSNRPDIYRIPTKEGVIQIVSLPWLRRSFLLAKEEMKNLDLAQISRQAQLKLINILEDKVRKLDPGLPSVLAAHAWVVGAKTGTEKSMTIGQEYVLLLSDIANPAFDYVALGHIHKHQILSENPPVVYSGSLEHLDFGEEDDDKGFYVAEIDPQQPQGKRLISCSFHPVKGRPFLSIEVNLEPDDPDPTETVLKEIKKNAETVREGIVRLHLNMSQETSNHLRDNDIKNAMAESHYFAIAKNISRQSRLRIGKRTEELKPLDILKTWLDSRNTPPERPRVLLEYAEKLIENQRTT